VNADLRNDPDLRAALPLLLTLGLGVFLGALDLSVLAPALPALGNEFAAANGDLSWVFTLYLLMNVVSIAVMSTLADRYGRKPIYILCILIFLAGSALAIVAQDYTAFLIARAIQALGAGGIFPVATAAVGDRVTLIGRNETAEVRADDWASWAQTINYEIVSRLPAHIPREFADAMPPL